MSFKTGRTWEGGPQPCHIESGLWPHPPGRRTSDVGGANHASTPVTLFEMDQLWAMATSSVTPYGEGVAVSLMLVGIGLIGTLTASAGSFFVEESKFDKQKDVVGRLERIELVLRELTAPALDPLAELGEPPASNGGADPQPSTHSGPSAKS